MIASIEFYNSQNANYYRFWDSTGNARDRTLHVISRTRLKQAAAKYSDIESAFDVWYRAAKHEEWSCLEDVRKTYPHADLVNGFTVFNIKGNRYRLIAKIEYRWKKVFIKHVLSHAEYRKEWWKES